MQGRVWTVYALVKKTVQTFNSNLFMQCFSENLTKKWYLFTKTWGGEGLENGSEWVGFFPNFFQQVGKDPPR